MSVIAKYLIKIGKVTVPPGTVGKVVTIDEVRKTFPNMVANQSSTQIAVKFLDLDWCIVHRHQLILK